MRAAIMNRPAVNEERGGWFVLAFVVLLAIAMLTAPGCMFAAGAAAGGGVGYAVGHEQGEHHAEHHDDD
ncbi:MAG: hypothetical protein R3B57_01150 [Phycisphaerales bacterium]